MNNIILCGFMGCGKTTVGKRLAKLTQMEFLDLDEEIEQECGLPIPMIFSQYGETYFRDQEHEAILRLSKRVNCVVSTGGGALTFQRNWEAVDARDRVLFLDAPFEVCYERIKDSDRPIVINSSIEELRSLFEARCTLYQKAAASGLTVMAGGEADPIAAEILRRLFEKSPWTAQKL